MPHFENLGEQRKERKKNMDKYKQALQEYEYHLTSPYDIVDEDEDDDLSDLYADYAVDERIIEKNS